MVPSGLIALLLASAPCPSGKTETAKIDDLFAPDPGCETEAASTDLRSRILYRGTIEGAGVATLDLTRIGGSLAGSLRYDGRRESSSVLGSANASGICVLTERDSDPNAPYESPPAKGLPTGRITGHLTEEKLGGQWRSPDGKTRRRVELTAVARSEQLTSKQILVTYPVFLPQTRHARLNKLIKKSAQSSLEAYRIAIDVTCTDCSYERSFYVENLRDDLVSLLLKTTERTGGAKQKRYLSHTTFRRSANAVEPLIVSDLFEPKACAALAQLITGALGAQGASDPRMSRKSCEAELLEGGFAVTTAGLQLVVDAADGRPKPYVVLLPREKIRGLLRPDAAALVASP